MPDEILVSNFEELDVLEGFPLGHIIISFFKKRDKYDFFQF